MAGSSETGFVKVRAEIRRMVDRLSQLEVVDGVDDYAIEALATAVIDLRKARAMVLKQGQVIKGAKGGLMRNPWSVAQKDAMDRMMHWCRLLGLTPASRKALGAAVQEVSAPGKKVLKGKAVGKGRGGRLGDPPELSFDEL